MKINIGSTNPSKIEALKEIIKDYPFLLGANISSIKVNSEVSDQPMGIKEITTGATNRAKNAFNNCDFSIGLEGGLIEVPNTKTGYMNVCACSIYDGKEQHLGLSCAFEIPKKVIKLVKEKKLNVSDAVYQSKISENKNIGYAEGIIGILTKGRITRKDYTKQSIQMALIQLENKELY